MNADSLIGYRKVIVVLIGMLFSFLVSKGMPEELATSLKGMIVEAIPTILAVAYMVFNQSSKKINLEQAKVTNGTATAGPIAVATGTTAAPVEMPAQSEDQQKPTVVEQPTTKPPDIDTMPPFYDADLALTNEQKEAIREWYTRAVTKPPEMPEIEKREATLYHDIKERDDQRLVEASNQIAMQAIDVFPGKDFDYVLKMRKNCDELIFERVTYHWTMARRRWIAYGIELWKYQEL